MSSNAPLSKLRDVSNLRQVAVQEEIMRAEFQAIPLCAATDADLPMIPGVNKKNRYTNVLPNPDSRVALSRVGADPLTEYINANYVSGFGNKPRRFIASQGPLPATIADFWRMVWECGVQCICMITGLVEEGREKCARYWPEKEGSKTEYGAVAVTVINVKRNDVFTTSSLELVYLPTKAKRYVEHLWFTSWPDHGVPASFAGVLDYLRAMRACTQGSEAPVLVHCSAGIGRTGTIMTLDTCIQELHSEWRVADVLGAVSNIRTERGGSVQTYVQYKFIYQALAEYVSVTFDRPIPHSMFGPNTPRAVELRKSAQRPYFGFVLRGSQPCFILAVDEGGVGFLSGVQPGDHILGINGKNVFSLAHKDIVDIFSTCGDAISLVLLSKTLY